MKIPTVIIVTSTLICCQPSNKYQSAINMDIAAIKTHLALQANMEPGDNNHPAYQYTVKDLELALPVIAQGLKDNHFIALDDTAFNKKIRNIFGDIFYDQCPFVKLRNKCYTIFANDSDKQDEFDYTKENLFIAQSYKFITYLPLLGDYLQFTDSNQYKITIHPALVARNKFLFNNSQSDLAWLLHEDTAFLKTLVVTFGYTQVPQINDLVMYDYEYMDEANLSTVGEIIFKKEATGNLDIKEALLQWVAAHTQVNNNRLLLGLEDYAYALFNPEAPGHYRNHPFHLFQMNEKRKILAYISNTYLSLYTKWAPANPGIWPAATVLNNQLNADTGLATFLQQQHYFSLPALKQELEPGN
ncbi:hypothetical protein ACDQ55_01880 [Chitinophaga sp. 30R24]|uniref:hypothetical protein n=1 Tax=Chitinophaga sp. 30R24 TaxID=3248838 RepID=UPI003B917324